MDPFDSIKEHVKTAAHSISSTVSTAVKTTTKRVADAVERAPAAISSGARQAVDAVKQLAKDPKATMQRAAEGAKELGKAAWKHRGAIGFWVGTASLLLAVPITGGASGAVAGGLAATRGAAIAARIAQTGKLGSAAVHAARTGAAAVQGIRGAFGGTKAAAALTKAGSAIHSGRVALGATKVGTAMNAASKPVNLAFNGIIGANFAETSIKYARGDASGKDLALATLAATPLAITGVRSVASRSAAHANAKAARVATKGLDSVASTASGASDKAAHVASVAPRMNAPKTAGRAAAAHDEAIGSVVKAQQVRSAAAAAGHRVSPTGSNINTTHLVNELDDVAARVGSARSQAMHAEQLAPSELAVTARQARARLDAAERVANTTRDRVAVLAQRQKAADNVVGSSDAAKATVDNVGTYVYTANNASAAAKERHAPLSMTDGSLAKNLAWILLGRTQHAAVTR